jgi:hypothetical protein
MGYKSFGCIAQIKRPHHGYTRCNVQEKDKHTKAETVRLDRPLLNGMVRQHFERIDSSIYAQVIDTPISLAESGRILVHV